MENSTHLMLAVGGVFLVTWYGAGRLRIESMQQVQVGPLAARLRPGLVALHGEFRRPPVAEIFPGGAAFCTHCGIEYPAGVPFCDCGAETIDGDDAPEAVPPSGLSCGPDAVFDSADDLVCIHVAEDYWQASLLKSYLENHDIPCATGGNSQTGAYHFSITPLSEVRLYVRGQLAARARQLLRDCIRD